MLNKIVIFIIILLLFTSCVLAQSYKLDTLNESFVFKLIRVESGQYADFVTKDAHVAYEQFYQPDHTFESFYISEFPVSDSFLLNVAPIGCNVYLGNPLSVVPPFSVLGQKMSTFVACDIFRVDLDLFFDSLRSKTGKQYRLPTIYELEYAFSRLYKQNMTQKCTEEFQSNVSGLGYIGSISENQILPILYIPSTSRFSDLNKYALATQDFTFPSSKRTEKYSIKYIKKEQSKYIFRDLSPLPPTLNQNGTVYTGISFNKNPIRYVFANCDFIFLVWFVLDE